MKVFILHLNDAVDGLGLGPAVFAPKWVAS